MNPTLRFVAAVLLTSAMALVAPQACAADTGVGRIDRGHIDAVLGGLVGQGRAVGVSALVWEDGREAYFGAFGHADREAGRPMARDTLVQVYSMTKPVTGVVLMSLFDEGRFALEDPLAKHLPEFADMRVFAGLDADGTPSYGAPRRPILVYDILRHTAGFSAEDDRSPVRAQWQALGIYDRSRTLEELSRAVAGLPLAFEPGSRWLYGVSVDIQARLAEALAGKPFAELMRERVLDPLRMHDTGYVLRDGQRERLAAVYRLTEDGFRRIEDADSQADVLRDWRLTPGGWGLVSTLDDFMRFGRMLLDDGTLGGVRVLAPGTVARMATDALPEDLGDRSWLIGKGQVGFGVDVAVRHSPPASRAEASGEVGEFFWDGLTNTLFWVDPRNRIVAVLFTQSLPPGGTDLHKQFRDAVYRNIPSASSASAADDGSR